MELETHDSCLAVLTVVLPSSVWGSRVFKMARRCLVLASFGSSMPSVGKLVYELSHFSSVYSF